MRTTTQKKTIRMIGKKISFFQFEELQTTRKNAPLLRVERKKRGETIKLTTTNENWSIARNLYHSHKKTHLLNRVYYDYYDLYPTLLWKQWFNWWHYKYDANLRGEVLNYIRLHVNPRGRNSTVTDATLCVNQNRYETKTFDFKNIESAGIGNLLSYIFFQMRAGKRDENQQIMYTFATSVTWNGSKHRPRQKNGTNHQHRGKKTTLKSRLTKKNLFSNSFCAHPNNGSL